MPDAKPNLVPSIVAGVVAAALGPLLWIGCWKALHTTWIPAIGVGALIGLSMRLVGRSNDRKLQVVAVILTVASAIPSYVWWDSYLWTPFMLGESVKRMVGDFQFVILTAVAAYLAYLLAHRNLAAPPAPKVNAEG